MKRSLLAAMCCAMLVFLVGSRGAISDGKGPVGNVAVSITTKQSNTAAIPIAATAGDEFVVTLNSNATTGYEWWMSGKPSSKIVTFVKSVYNAPGEAVPGRGGTESWTFKAVGQGNTTITLTYVRPWEKGVAPVRVQRFDVSVK